MRIEQQVQSLLLPSGEFVHRQRLEKRGADRDDAAQRTELAGDPITGVLARAPGNDAPIGGIKVVAESGWFAARPSGTEEVYKIYAESFRGDDHLHRIQAEAQELIARVFKQAASKTGN